MSETVIRMSSVSVRFGDKQVLDGLDLQVGAGQDCYRVFRKAGTVKGPSKMRRWRVFI